MKPFALTLSLVSVITFFAIVLSLNGCQLGTPIPFGTPAINGTAINTGSPTPTPTPTPIPTNSFSNANLIGVRQMAAFGQDSTGNSETMTGTLNFDGQGGIDTPNLTFTDGAGNVIPLTFQSGTYQVNLDGSFTATIQILGAAGINLAGAINSTLDVGSYTYQRIGGISSNVQGLGQMAASQGTFTNANMPASLGFLFFGVDSTNVFFVSQGSINTSQGGGTILSGSGTDDAGGSEIFQPGTFNIAANGDIGGAYSAAYVINKVGFDTEDVTSNGALSTTGDFVAANFTSIFRTQGVQQRGLFPLVGLGGFHTNANLVGTLQLQDAQLIGVGTGRITTGSISVDGFGNVTGGLLNSTDVNGNVTPASVTGGTYIVQTNGAFVANVQTTNETLNLTGFLSADSTVVLAFFDNGNGNKGVLSLVH